MTFEWTRFLDARGIFYATSGRNVAAGAVAVRCPYCGADDPSQHMVIRLNGKGWWCWRNRQHRGGNAARLVSALLNISYQQAAEITGERIFVPDNFMSRVSELIKPEAPKVMKRKPLSLPPEFKPFKDLPSARPFANYLMSPQRGFTRQQIFEQMTPLYDLHYAMRGPDRYRVILPVIFEGEVVSWTARAINPHERLRYRTLSADPEKAAHEGREPARAPINYFLPWFDDLMAAADDYHAIVLTEGPFDALKLRILGAHIDIESTCFFTSAPTEQQIDLLHELLPRFERRFLLLDEGMMAQAMHLQRLLASLRVEPIALPRGIKDPGLLTNVGFITKALTAGTQCG